MAWPFCRIPGISLWLEWKVDVDGEEGRNYDVKSLAQLDTEFVFYPEDCGMNVSVEDGLEERKAAGRETGQGAIAITRGGRDMEDGRVSESANCFFYKRTDNNYLRLHGP